MRKYYIDNLRSLCILLLFPFHAAMIFNGFGEPWYLHSKQSILADLFNRATYPWWMSGLFVMAGMSTVYALRKRNAGQYVKERFLKLLLPLVSAILLIIPVQAYIADRFYNGYTGTYLQHFSRFFQLSDWSGYDGHFTPGQGWFILFLFVISMVCLPLMIWYKKREKKMDASWFTMPVLLLLCIFPSIGHYIFDVGGKSFCEFGMYFLLGYFVLSEEKVQEKLEKNSTPLGVAWMILMVLRCTMYAFGAEGSVWFFVVARLFGWIGILAMLGLGKRFLEFKNGFTTYFAPASFPIYLLHQSVVVVVGYLVVTHIPVAGIQYVMIVAFSFVLTILLYEILRRFFVTRFLLGMKKLP